MLKVKNIKVSFDDFLLSVDLLPWSEDKITCLMGESGSGKSTLLKVLMGIVSSGNSSFVYKDKDLSQLNVSDRRLGVVLQEGGLFPHLTVFDNLHFAGEARGIGSKIIEQKISHGLKELNIKTLKGSKVSSLSGGEYQRVSLLRAYMGEPQIVLMDEPFTALDQKNKELSMKYVKRQFAKHKAPTLIVTHSKEDVSTLDAKCIFMDKGQIVSQLP